MRLFATVSVLTQSGMNNTSKEIEITLLLDGSLIEPQYLVISFGNELDMHEPIINHLIDGTIYRSGNNISILHGVRYRLVRHYHSW